MFGIESFDQFEQITEGHLKEITRQENELHDQRIAICKKCPLYESGPLGPICSSRKCVKGDEVFKYPEPGATCGCGCRLSAKTRLKGATCVLNKW